MAYALNDRENLEFSPTGLGDPDQPAIWQKNGHGISLWIEIGNPSARKIHKASKAAEKVKIYTYKDPQVLLNELNSEPIHRKDKLEIFSLAADFLDQLEGHTKKDNKWTVINMDGTIMVNGEGFDLQCEIKRHQVV